jgi:hypothetical protein
MVICYILRQFGIFWGNLVLFPRFGILYPEKSGSPGQIVTWVKLVGERPVLRIAVAGVEVGDDTRSLNKGSLGCEQGTFLISPLGVLWTRSWSCSLGLKLPPRGEDTRVHPSILLYSRECSPLGVNERVNIPSRDQSSPLGAKLTPRANVVQNWPQASTPCKKVKAKQMASLELDQVSKVWIGQLLVSDMMCRQYVRGYVHNLDKKHSM